MTSNNSNDSQSSSDSSSANNSFIFNASSNSNDPSTSSDSPASNGPSDNNNPSSTSDSSDSSSSLDNNNIDRSSSINPPNLATSSNLVVALNYSDARCRFCDHNRLDCPVCRPRRTSHRSRNKAERKRHIKARGKVYCCKCSHSKKLTRHFDPANKEKTALIKYATLKGIAAAELRASITNALKDK
jgi:hypothetical protein